MFRFQSTESIFRFLWTTKQTKAEGCPLCSGAFTSPKINNRDVLNHFGPHLNVKYHKEHLSLLDCNILLKKLTL